MFPAANTHVNKSNVLKKGCHDMNVFLQNLHEVENPAKITLNTVAILPV